ncbi:MAG: PEGA domain-containing protein [Sandaracinaceae bacterium]|nr:PEGA domain-containing protein [Sandaracinaceae bacterium]
MRRAIVVALALAASSVVANAARAQDAAGARAAFEEGRQHAAAERWAEALEDFERSFELFERPPTLFNIASVLVRLGRAREAIATIDRYVELTAASPDRRMLRDAQALREVAAQSLRTLELEVAPDDARVTVDGDVAEGSGPRRSIVLDPGAHVLEITAPGHAPARNELPSDATTLAVTLDVLPGELELGSDVEGAELSVDGEPVGTTQATLTLAAGMHAVRVVAEAHEPFERQVQVQPGETIRVFAQLVPIIDEPGVLESPLFWGIAGGVLAVGVVVLVLALTIEGPVADPYGGTAQVVVQPLIEF